MERRAPGRRPRTPPHFAASATPTHTITAWHIDVEGVDEFAGAMTASSITAGAYTVVVRAWDSTGAFGDRTLKLNGQ